MNKKISQRSYLSKSNVSAADLIGIVDVSAGANGSKKITVDDLINGWAEDSAGVDDFSESISLIASLNNTRGIHVDDFYLDAHGSDHAPSIRLAATSAITNGIYRISLSPKVYNLNSNVPTVTGANANCAIRISSTSRVTQLEIDGNGAILKKIGVDYADILYIQLPIDRLIIRNLTFWHDHSAPVTAQWCGGFVFAPYLADIAVTEIVLENCNFIGCNRSWDIGHTSGNFLKAAYSQCRNVRIIGGSMLYPRGSNMDADLFPDGGSQAAFCNPFVEFLDVDGMVFDGATTGDVTGIGNERPLDGMFIGGAIHSRFRNCKMRHYGFEGIFPQKSSWWLANDGGSFTVPAIGSNFTMPIYSGYSTAGWLAGEHCFLKSDGLAYGGDYTHEFEVISIAAHSLTLKNISGATGTLSGFYRIIHEWHYTKRHSLLVENLISQDITVIPRVDYSPLVIKGIDDVEVNGGTIGECESAIELYWVDSASVNNARIDSNKNGVLYANPEENCKLSVTGCHIRLMGNSAFLVGINGFPNNGIYTNNYIWMDEADSGIGTGIRLGDETRESTGCVIDHNVFLNLNTNVLAPDAASSYIYGEGNSCINVAAPQTDFPKTFANDAAAATGGIPIRGIYRKATGVLTWRQS